MTNRKSETAVLTALELYELVWNRPVSEIAKEYGLSDVGLAKICRRHGVPLPERGYWQKKRSGRRVKQPALPKGVADQEIHFVAQTQEEPDAAYNNALARLEERLSGPPSVPETLENAEPLVRRTQKSLNGAKTDEKGLRRPRARQALNVRMAPDNIDRAMRIMDGLLKTFAQVGIEIRRPAGEQLQTHVVVEGESLEIALEERTRRVECPPPPPRRRKSRGPDFSALNWEKYEFHPTGRLCLMILDYGGRNLRRSWCDGKKNRLEDYLRSFTEGLVKVAVAKRLDREHWDRWQRAQDIKRRQRAERRQRKEAEQARVKDLEEAATAWRRSRDIREYLAAVEAEADPNDEALHSWLTWARDYADWLDPLTDSPPSVLDEPAPEPRRFPWY